MKTNAILFGTCLFCLSLISCEKDDDSNTLDYDQKVIISADLYDNAPSDFLTINSVFLFNDGYLLINFSASGCGGESWEVKLIDSGAIYKSDPPQRNLRLSLKDEELCDAYLTREILFDIHELQVEGNQVILNLTNYTLPILYEY